MGRPRVHARLVVNLAEFYGKQCAATVDGIERNALVFDWATLRNGPKLIERVFADCNVSADYPGFIGWAGGKSGAAKWCHPSTVPFALFDVPDGEGAGLIKGAHHPQFGILLLCDSTKSDGPVWGIDVEGTAHPAAKPRKIAPRLSALKLRVAANARRSARKPVVASSLPCEPERVAKLRAGFRPGVDAKAWQEALELLRQITGDPDCGEALILGGRRRKWPEGRDPRWINALTEGLLEATGWKWPAAEMALLLWTGALASFGPPGAAAIGIVLDALAKEHPRKSVVGLIDAPFAALGKLKSDVGVGAAASLLSRSNHEQEQHLTVAARAVEYLCSRAAGGAVGAPRTILAALAPTPLGQVWFLKKMISKALR